MKTSLVAALVVAFLITTPGSITIDAPGERAAQESVPDLQALLHRFGPIVQALADPTTAAHIEPCPSLTKTNQLACPFQDPAAAGHQLVPAGSVVDLAVPVGLNPLLDDHIRPSGWEDEPHGFVPCSDPRGCPDLITDVDWLEYGIYKQVRSFTEGSCDVQEGSTTAGDRLLLRFNFGSPNIGSGDLIIGDPDDHPEWFEWGLCHNHWHFKEYADYRLWTPIGFTLWDLLRNAYPDVPAGAWFETYPALDSFRVAGHKQGFCVIDLYRYVNLGDHAKYTNCATNQGISRGYGDLYSSGLPGQYVDITGVLPGEYVLEAEVNPERFYTEEDYSNNRAYTVVTV